MAKYFRDPLIHFLLAGAVLFAVFYLRGESSGGTRPRILITAEQVAQLGQGAALLRGRELTAAELESVIEPAIREEVLYREALALELDVDDDEVRRRLVEKMQYLSEDLADPEPATEAELRAFFAANPELFRVPERVTFDQIFFSPRERGASVTADAEAALAELRAGHEGQGLGDRTPLEDRFTDASRERVEVLFGERLTDAVFAMTPGGWAGPYESDFGLHLVRLLQHSASRLPAFDEARELALQVYAEQRRNALNEQRYAEMRARYEVIVDWPAADEPAEP